MPFAILKTKRNEEIRTFTRKTGGKALTKSDFFTAFSVCFKYAMTTENAQSGFSGTGLFSVHQKAILPPVFTPSKKTLDVSQDKSSGCQTDP